MTNMAASWRAILSGFFHSASLTEATLGPGPATNTGEPGIAGVPESQSRQGPPNIEDYATIEAIVNGEPVYCLDYMMYIYGISPDLMPGIVMQEGNTHPRVKIKLKKS